MHRTNYRDSRRLARLAPILLTTLTTVAFLLIFQSMKDDALQSSQKPVFSLFVTLEFKEDSYRDQFFTDIQPVVEHCRLHEPNTLTYKVIQSDIQPLQLTMMERYTDREQAYLEVHKSSEPFLEFRGKLKAMQDSGKVKISGHSYLDTDIGYFTK